MMAAMVKLRCCWILLLGCHDPGDDDGSFALCTEEPVQLPAPPEAQQSRGCVVRYDQQLSDPVQIAVLGTDVVERRYLVYVPEERPHAPLPLVFMFPGYGASAEAAALYYTHTRFEQLADEHGFVVVYGNGLPNVPPGEMGPAQPEGGYLQGCFSPHTSEGVDVEYVRQIVDQLDTELAIDRSRVYAAGLSAGGGMALQLAIEAPDLVAAIAPVVPLPFQPSGIWLHQCQPKAGHAEVSIAMLAATGDRFVSYTPGPSPMYPQAIYPGMEETRDVWLQALGISGAPQLELLPDLVQGDSYGPHTGLQSSHIERTKYAAGASGAELWYYKAVGMGHWWPNPLQTVSDLWPIFGKTNQDIDFADHAWEFFQRHAKAPQSYVEHGGGLEPLVPQL